MSIKVTTRVWDESQQEGSALLTLLALADWANDDGIAWPRQERLAQRARVTARQVRNLTRELETDGELFTAPGRGRKKRSFYAVTTALSVEVISAVLQEYFDKSPEEAHEIATSLVEKQKCSSAFQKTGNPASGKPEIQRQKKRKSSADESGDSGDPLPTPDSDPSFDPSSLERSESIAAKAASARSKAPNAGSVPEGSELKEKSSAKKEKPTPLHVAIIETWWVKLPDAIRPPGKPPIKPNVRDACDLRDAGFTAELVGMFVEETYPSYLKWAAKHDAPAVMSLRHVKTYIRSWMSKKAEQNAKHQPVDEQVRRERERAIAERYGFTYDDGTAD